MIKEPIRAAVISDTHGLLRPEVEQIIESCDVVIHAGDFDNQMLYHKLKIKQPLYAVRGNNDGYWAEQLPTVRRFAVGGFQFLMAHDCLDIPQDLGDAQIIIFGHSHMHAQKLEEGRLWLNPGSCGYRRFTLPLSLVVLTLGEDGCEAETVWLEEDNKKEGTEKKSTTVCLEKSQLISSKSKTGGTEKEGRKERGKETRKEMQRKLQRHKERIREKFPGFSKKKETKRTKDQLFLVAKIMHLMKRGESVEWVASNLKVPSGLVETVYRIYVTHPGVNAHQILDKMEVNQAAERKK